jgi:hypothetical protein
LALDHPIHQPVSDRLFAGQVSVALDVGVNALDRLTRVLGRRPDLPQSPASRSPAEIRSS